jgi:hypothetical protein
MLIIMGLIGQYLMIMHKRSVRWDQMGLRLSLESILLKENQTLRYRKPTMCQREYDCRILQKSVG